MKLDTGLFPQLQLFFKYTKQEDVQVTFYITGACFFLSGNFNAAYYQS